jgi:hypothetical protein
MSKAVGLGYIIGLICWLLFMLYGPYAYAQNCGPTNPSCLVPLPPQSDNSNRAAPTKWVKTFAPTITLGGDVTGTTSSNTVSKIQGTVVTGTTGTGKVVFSAAPSIDSLSVTTGLNVVYTSTYAPGTRGPVFLWANPPGTGGTGTTLAAGQNALLQGWVGNNPTPTPAVNSPVAVTFAMTNGNYRGQTGSTPAGLEVMNLLGVICGPAEGQCTAAEFTDAPMAIFEADISNSASYPARNRMFNSTSGSYNKVVFEAFNSPAVAQVTAGFAVWTPSANLAGAFYEGAVFSRISDVGIEFVANPLGVTDTYTAFNVCAICDNSNSTTFAKFGNLTHTGSMIDVSSGASFVGFYKGSSTATTNVLFYNGANFTNEITVDSGFSSSQTSAYNLNDQGALKWQIGKPSGNTFNIFNAASGNSSMIIAASDAVTFKAGIIVGSTTLLTTSVALTNNAAAATATLTNAPTSGNPTKWIPINDNGVTRNIPAW